MTLGKILLAIVVMVAIAQSNYNIGFKNGQKEATAEIDRVTKSYQVCEAVKWIARTNRCEGVSYNSRGGK